MDTEGIRVCGVRATLQSHKSAQRLFGFCEKAQGHSGRHGWRELDGTGGWFEWGNQLTGKEIFAYCRACAWEGLKHSDRKLASVDLMRHIERAHSGDIGVHPAHTTSRGQDKL